MWNHSDMITQAGITVNVFTIKFEQLCGVASETGPRACNSINLIHEREGTMCNNETGTRRSNDPLRVSNSARRHNQPEELP